MGHHMRHMVFGHVTSSQPVKLSNGNVAIHVQRGDGKDALVDLGSPQSLGDLKIRQGETVIIRGQETTQPDGTSIFQAYSVAPVYHVRQGQPQGF